MVGVEGHDCDEHVGHGNFCAQKIHTHDVRYFCDSNES